jgi:hypothetical protein
MTCIQSVLNLLAIFKAIASFAVLVWLSQDPNIADDAASFVYRANDKPVNTVTRPKTPTTLVSTTVPTADSTTTLWSWISSLMNKKSDALLDHIKSKYERELVRL